MAYSPRSSEILVNAHTPLSQTGPSVTRLANGNLIAVWATPTTAAANQFGISAQLFDSSGNKLGNHFFLTSLTVRGQLQPDVTPLPNGGFALTWLGFTSMSTIVKSQFFNADGTPNGVEQTIDFGPNFSDDNPEVIALADGSIAVVWTDDLTTDSSVGGAIVTPAGTVTPFTVNTTETGIQGSASIAALTGGNFVVTWTDLSGLGGDADGGIKAQIFTPAGTMVGSEFLVNTTTAGLQNNVHVAGLAGGGFVTVWSTPSGGRGQIFDALGNKVGAEFSTPGAGRITVRPDGGFVVTFTSSDGDGSGLSGQQFASDGTLIGGVFAINSVTSGNQFDSTSVLLGDGDLFVIWQDESGIGGDNDGSGIKARIFTSVTSGTESGDTFTGTPGNDEYNGLGGNDTFLMQQGGIDQTQGGNGDDTFYFGNAYTAADRVDGGAGNDRLFLQGQYGNLQLNAQSLTNLETIILLTASNAVFEGATANPTFYSITSVDSNVAAGASMTVDGRQLGSNEYLNFNGSAETDGAFFLYGGAAADTLTGGAGRDTLDGGAANDTMAGGGGDDIYFVDHPADVVLEAVGGGGFDSIYTRVNYVLRAGSEVEQLAITGIAPGVGVALTGNEFSQSLISGSGNDDLNGGGGADFLTAFAGNDRLDGGTGVDVLTGGAGDDVYFVDDFSDVVVELAGEGNDAVYASTTYLLSGGARVELLATTGIGPGQAVTLYGNDFAQSIIGASGDDTLYGLGGDDSIEGNDGADRVDGGAGVDVLRGGAGADVFQFTNASDSSGAGDNVLDFVSGTDKIDLSLIDANTNVEGNASFTFIGTGAFTGVAGQLRVESSGGLVNVYGDVNGDGVADLIIHLYNTGGVVPNAGDFIL